MVLRHPGDKVVRVDDDGLHGQYSGEIVAYRMARRPVFEMVSSMLEAALTQASCAADLIVHSDQSWHYKMQPYRAMLARRGVKQSMSRKGNCFDNAAIEGFFRHPEGRVFPSRKARQD